MYSQVAEKIIEEQEGIIGPVAIEQARKVPGLKLDWANHQVSLEGDEKTILEQLVDQYKELFGQTSVEVCKQAVRGLLTNIPQNQIPSVLL